jgi:Putative zinc-finger
MNHIPADLLDRYAGADRHLGADTVWAVEAHLESCAPCRQGLGAAVHRREPDLVALLERVRTGLDTELGPATRPRASRTRARMARWAAPTLLPWLGMTVLVILTALGFDLAERASGGRAPSLVLLLAPVAPLLGVAVAWAQGRDPAQELVTATPRAGLYLVFRRTAAVLAAVLPVLAAAGWVVGASPARWLLPSLAFTVGALAFGSVVGLPRAAATLALAWAAAVVAPSLLTARAPVVLEPVSAPAWAAFTALVAVVLVARRGAYARLLSSR